MHRNILLEMEAKLFNLKYMLGISKTLYSYIFVKYIF